MRDPAFAAKAARVLDLYAGIWDGQPLGSNDYVICADEKTSIQARCRCHPTLPPGKARAMRVEHDYWRGGALAYLAAWDVHLGRVTGRCEHTTGIAPFSRLAGQVMTAEQREVVRIAREAVARRPAGCDQANLLSELPPELGEHIGRLHQSPAGAAMFAEGWDVAIVDVTRVCVFQPSVVADDAVERVAHVKADDISAIAEISLPTCSAEPLQARFDPRK